MLFEGAGAFFERATWYSCLLVDWQTSKGALVPCLVHRTPHLDCDLDGPGGLGGLDGHPAPGGRGLEGNPGSPGRARSERKQGVPGQ